MQRYNGPSRWQFLREVRQAFPNKTILGSGDLFTAADCLRMIHETGVDGVTIARGAIGNPWIFEQAIALASGLPLPAPPSLWGQRAVMERHWQLAESLYGPDRTPTLMRKFGIKYSASHPEHLDVRPRFAQIRSQGDWRQVLEECYREDLPGVYPPASEHSAQTEGCGV